jgi:hypothetical protein
LIFNGFSSMVFSNAFEEMAALHTPADLTAWKKKAMAFVTRSHRHLWGKNNEDPLVFLYFQGLTHDFIRQMHLGWNKHTQHRDLEKWGVFNPGPGKTLSRVRFPAGIVLPYIVKKNLQSVVILPMTDTSRPWLMPGSRRDIVLGLDESLQPVVFEDPFAGLRHFQATGTPVYLKPESWEPVTCEPSGPE